VRLVVARDSFEPTRSAKVWHATGGGRSRSFEMAPPVCFIFFACR
jgi:hypothetical protein